MTSDWVPLREALDRARDGGRTVQVWLRDDDCIAPTPELDRLARLCDGLGLSVLLAVIPEPAEPALTEWIGDHAGFAPCQHGFAHANHAGPGERTIELGGGRPLGAVLDDLRRGRTKLQGLFGPRLSDALVPPWNRIDPALLPHLPGLGFTALSTIAPAKSSGAIARLDSDLDIMDWRRGRVGRAPAEVAAAAARVLARQDSLGLLTHHLAHDEGAWAVLGSLLEVFAAHLAVRFVHAGAVRGRDRPTEGHTGSSRGG